MKRFTAFFLTVSLCFISSCAGTMPGNLLQYQNSSWKIDIECVQGDTHYSAILLLDRANDRCRIQYTAPANLCGIELSKSTSGCELSVFGITVPIEEYAADEMLRISKLFEIEPQTVCQFFVRADDSYLAIFESEDERYEVILDRLSSTPKMIDATINDESISIKINSMELLN